MKIYDKAKTGRETILSLVNGIKSEKIEKLPKQEIDKKIRTLDIIEGINKKTNARIGYLKAKIKKDPNGAMALYYMDELDLLKKGKKVLYKEKNGNEKTLELLPTWHLKNDIKKAQGKDFKYIINDGFNRYTIKRSEIVKMKDNSFFLNKLKKGVEKAIKELKSKPDLDKQERKKLKILEKRLIPVIDFNSQVDENGKKDFNKLDGKFKKQVKHYFDVADNDNNKIEDDSEYPLLLYIKGELIEFFT